MSGEEEKKPTVANLYAKQKEWGNDISRERNKGLFKRILKEGSVSDKPVDGSKVEVHYVGRLLDGTVFDSSRERETTFEFVLGNSESMHNQDVICDRIRIRFPAHTHTHTHTHIHMHARTHMHTHSALKGCPPFVLFV